MWHEARKQERKIRGMLVDYRKRAERRQDFYEKIKADPTQFMQIHSRKCKIHLDPAVAAAGDSPAIMMPWQGQQDNMIDRFDGRAYLDLDKIPFAPKIKDGEEITPDERQCNYERYRILAQNDFLGISEEKYLLQLHLEEQFGLNAQIEQADKPKKKTGGAAIGYTYEDSNDPTPFSHTISQVVSTSASGGGGGGGGAAAGADDDSDSDLDVDVAIDISKIDTAQAHELNACGRHYGMKSNDFYSFLTRDADEADALKLAREEEQEKIMLSGRKSRRERRAQRERRYAGRPISPPSYAAKEEPAFKDDDEKNDSADSRSPTPENSGKITYITSFGGEDELQPHSKISINFNKNTKQGNATVSGGASTGNNKSISYADKVKENLDKLKKLNNIRRSSTSESPKKPLAYQRRSSYSRSPNRSRTNRSSGSFGRHRGTGSNSIRTNSYSHRRSRSRSRRNRRRSSRSSSRRRNRRRTRSRSRRRYTRSKSRQTSRPIRRRYTSSSSSSSSVASIKRRKPSSSSSTSSRASSRKRSPVKLSSPAMKRSRSKSIPATVTQSTFQPVSTDEQIGDAQPIQLPISMNQVTTQVEIKPAINAIKIAEPIIPIKRYYGRKREDHSSSDEDGDADEPMDTTSSDRVTGNVMATSLSNTKFGKQVSNNIVSTTSSTTNISTATLPTTTTPNTTTITSTTTTTTTTIDTKVPTVSMIAAANTTSKSSSFNPRDRLKRKMQILLNKQYKADKLAEIEKTERQVQQQQEREDEMRELALRLRRRQRELRHKYGTPTSSHTENSDKSSDEEDVGNVTIIPKNGSQSMAKRRSKSRSRSRSKIVIAAPPKIGRDRSRERNNTDYRSTRDRVSSAWSGSSGGGREQSRNRSISHGRRDRSSRDRASRDRTSRDRSSKDRSSRDRFSRDRYAMNNNRRRNDSRDRDYRSHSRNRRSTSRRRNDHDRVRGSSRSRKLVDY